MADYRSWYNCKECGTERSSFSSGPCPGCQEKRKKAAHAHYMATFDENPRQAFSDLVDYVLHLAFKTH